MYPMYTLLDSLFTEPLAYTRPRSNVYVISDSQYQDYQRTQAERQIAALENQMKTYQGFIDESAAKVAELKEAVGLLPEAEKNKELAEAS